MLTPEQLDAAARHLCTLEGKEPTEAQLAHARAVICCHAYAHEAIKQAVLYGAEPFRPASAGSGCQARVPCATLNDCDGSCAPYIAGPEDAHRSHSRKHLAHRMQLQRIWEALNVNSTDEALQEIQRMQELAGASATTYLSVPPEAMRSPLGTRTGRVPSTAAKAPELPQGPSGDTLADFSDDQWWVCVLQATADNCGRLNNPEHAGQFKRSVAVVMNLIATVKAHLEGTVGKQHNNEAPRVPNDPDGNDLQTIWDFLEVVTHWQWTETGPSRHDARQAFKAHAAMVDQLKRDLANSEATLAHAMQTVQEQRRAIDAMNTKHQPGISGVFQLGARARKTKGSEWSGTIVGYYSTTLTPIGWAVESEAHAGSVQIYPESALELIPDGESK